MRDMPMQTDADDLLGAPDPLQETLARIRVNYEAKNVNPALAAVIDRFVAAIDHRLRVVSKRKAGGNADQKLLRRFFDQCNEVADHDSESPRPSPLGCREDARRVNDKQLQDEENLGENEEEDSGE